MIFPGKFYDNENGTIFFVLFEQLLFLLKNFGFVWNFAQSLYVFIWYGLVWQGKTRTSLEVWGVVVECKIF